MKQPLKPNCVYVKAMVPINTDYYVNVGDYPYSTRNTYYTTIEVNKEDLPYTRYIKSLARENLTKQIAQKEWGNIRRWKSIDIDTQDIQIIK